MREPRSSRAHAGMGLGLAIVRRFAALLGHRIEVASRVGRGSRFRVLAPRAPARAPRCRAAPHVPHAHAGGRAHRAARWSPSSTTTPPPSTR